MSREVKVGLVNEAVTVVPRRQKKKVTQEKKGSVNIWELDSDNSNIDRDLFDESDTDKLSD